MLVVRIGVPAALLLATLAAQAQEFPRWEAFGGFSYAKTQLSLFLLGIAKVGSGT